jgi:anthranilate phosphoribosyltransferase
MDFKQPLSATAMRTVMQAVMRGDLPEEEVRDFLVSLAERGETAEEIAAAAAVLREHAVPLPLPEDLAVGDTCGTGGDGHGTINISTLAALVAAAGGARIVKHGNRAASSRCGSADVLEALGVNLEATPEQIARSVHEYGFGFCFAPRFHPAMKQVAAVRKALGRRTIFNLIGPLANPARLTFQLLGVPNPSWMPLMMGAMRTLGIRRGCVVHGADGMDELSVTGPNRVMELNQGVVHEFVLDAQEYGLPVARLEDLKGGDVAFNAGRVHAVLAGEASAQRTVVVLNAGVVLYLAGRADTVAEGIRLAQEALDTGRAAALLTKVAEATHAR